jgi:hypothetical protein
MASKNAKRDAKKIMNSPIGVIIIVIAVIIGIVKLITG